jgi:hypothetical protein
MEHRLGPDWKAIDCPLCFETTKSGEKDVTAHLSRHLVEIASASLPRYVDSDAESESDASSERAGTDISVNRVGDLMEPDTAASHVPQTSSPNEQFSGVQQEPQEASNNEAGNSNPIAQQTLLSTARESEAGQALRDPAHASSPPSAPALSSQHFVSDHNDDAAIKTMARRRESCSLGDVTHQCRDCKKQFKRPCDLTRHEKSHTRPWKCFEEECEYFELGWPTEKQRDGHVQDKHVITSISVRYKCLCPPCTFESKRESNRKQHMEKAHGREYVRSKTNGRKKSQAIAGSSHLITPSPDDFYPNVFATPSIGVGDFATSTEPLAHDSGMGSHVNVGPQQLTPAFSVDGNYDRIATLPQMMQPHLSLNNLQSQYDEGFGDAMDLLDMSIFSRPTENFTPFDRNNSSTNDLGRLFPEFDRLEIPQTDQIYGRESLHNAPNMESTLDELLGINPGTLFHRDSRADADGSGGLNYVQIAGDWVADSQVDGIIGVPEGTALEVPLAEDRERKVDGANESLPGHSKTSPEASKSREKESDLACNICGKVFTTTFHRKNHELSHRGGRPFECPDCGKAFTRAIGMERHQKHRHRVSCTYSEALVNVANTD